MARIEFLRAGPLATVQDLGRYGYQQFGVPTAGAADRYRFQLGNLLLGNAGNAAALEYWVLGPDFQVIEGSVQVALMGSDALWTQADGTRLSVPGWRSLTLHSGDRLTVGMTTDGAVGYICFAGGIDVPEVMGSRSTYVRGKFGGFEGRPVRDKDVLVIGEMHEAPQPDRAWASAPLEPSTGTPLRVVLGPQADFFDDDGIERFFSQTFKVSPQSDRMGKRLVGDPLTFAKGRTADIVSDAMAHGSIQVPGSGEPIVMLCDRATVGGYAKIGTVISADLPRFARLKPGSEVSFQRVSVGDAEAALRLLESNMTAWVSVAASVG
jgi:biotin-dependent carboxylase-like uncharacterized protein